MFGIRPTPTELPYVARESLLTPAERSFYGALCMAVADRHLIFCKVRLADLVTVAKGVEKWQSHFNRISAKHVDFVLCAQDTLAPVVAIELDDKSHGSSSRQDRDAFVDDVLDAAGIPIVRVRASRSYNAHDIRRMINEKTKGS